MNRHILTQEDYDIIHDEKIAPETKKKLLGYPPYSISELRNCRVGFSPEEEIDRHYAQRRRFS